MGYETSKVWGDCMNLGRSGEKNLVKSSVGHLYCYSDPHVQIYDF